MRARLNFYKVRFHLAKGENYMKWQIIKNLEQPSYVDSNLFRITMSVCTLKNNRRLAREIHQGQNKKVCAWILCDSVKLEPASLNTPEGSKIMFNPRRVPFWTDGLSDLDNRKYSKISSLGRELFALE